MESYYFKISDVSTNTIIYGSIILSSYILNHKEVEKQTWSIYRKMYKKCLQKISNFYDQMSHLKISKFRQVRIFVVRISSHIYHS